MIDPSWRRIAGFHAQDDGHIGVVWLAIDLYSDVAHLYDAAVFKREVMAVVAEGISARGGGFLSRGRRAPRSSKSNC